GEKTAASPGKLRLQSIFCDRKVVGGRPSGNPYEAARSANHPRDRFISFASQKSCVGNFATVIANQDEERIPCPARRASLKLPLLRVPRHWKIQSRGRSSHPYLTAGLEKSCSGKGHAVATDNGGVDQRIRIW